ncbi:DSBA-like thioredoxin domain protein [Aspergillus sclerotialis]|uniref:DSBA-like thioredoxin domain protein n=1 Tax=Aspergillus sclerotialis TaxID=2070753 RepID=A0A3A3A080_9EURO|nr:DSBA-like thioredoxin domain protein [Aspergillus sclerotialis]
MLKKMSSERASQVQEHLKKLGVGEGIAFKFGGRVGSSMPSRQLLHLARSKGPIVQTTVAEELFRFLWECEKEISQTEILVEIGVLSGLDGKEVRQALKEGRGVEEVEKEQREAKEDGLDGVPHYVVGGKIHLEGAVDLGDFFNALVKAKESNGE